MAAGTLFCAQPKLTLGVLPPVAALEGYTLTTVERCETGQV
jgi:hypothetical protein